MPSKVNSLALLLHSLLLSFVRLVPIESSHSQQHIRLIKLDKSFLDEIQYCCQNCGQIEVVVVKIFLEQRKYGAGIRITKRPML